MVTIAAEDREWLRRTPAFRRSVWAMRLGVLSLLLMGFFLVLVAVDASPKVSVPTFAVGITVSTAAVGLMWSALMPLEKAKRQVLTKYDLDPFERSVFMNKLLGRDMIRFRRG